MGTELTSSRPPAGDVLLESLSLRLDERTSVQVLRHRCPSAAAGRPVLYAHGIQSHPGWFVASAQAMARAGHEVFQVTRRGSGLVEKDRGDAASADQLLADTAKAMDFIAQQTGAQSISLAGVSWGGKLLAAYALGGDRRIASLTLIAPGIVPRVDVPLGQKLAIAAARLCCSRRPFDIPLSAPALFTDNPAMREYLRADPHRLHRATARFLVASAMLDRRLRRARPGAIVVPTTLILASGDRIIDNAATQDQVLRLTGGAAKIVELPGRHTLEFEPDPADFFATLAAGVG